MLLAALETALQFSNVLYAFLGVAAGIFFGALPGIGPTLAVALMLPFTFTMDAVATLIFLGSVYAGAIYGGSISAILIKTPGTAGNVATTFDGYPMAEKGQGGVALGLSAMASGVGGVFGIVLCLLVAPPIARLSLAFGPAEYTMLALLGLSIISIVSRGSTIKGLIMACFGLMIGFVGYDLISGYIRFSFGWSYLEDGISLVPTMTGLFGISQALILAEQGGAIAKAGKVMGSAWRGAVMVFRYPITLLRSCAIGAVLGTMPGIGIVTAQFLSYNETVRASKKPETFGKGNPEGLIASEAANNAVEGGALIPTLTLGLPGSLTAALFLGALMIQGLRPGMELFSGPSGGVAVTALLGMILGLGMMVIIGLAGGGLFARLTAVRTEFLVPMIIALTLTGAFAVRNSYEDMALSFAFGLIGYLMTKNGYPMVPFVLALILGPIAEEGFNRSLLISGGSYAYFLQRPISAVLLIITIISFMQPYLSGVLSRVKRRRAT